MNYKKEIKKISFEFIIFSFIATSIIGISTTLAGNKKANSTTFSNGEVLTSTEINNLKIDWHNIHNKPDLSKIKVTQKELICPNTGEMTNIFVRLEERKVGNNYHKTEVWKTKHGWWSADLGDPYTCFARYDRVEERWISRDFYKFYDYRQHMSHEDL